MLTSGRTVKASCAAMTRATAGVAAIMIIEAAVESGFPGHSNVPDVDLARNDRERL